MSTQHIYPPTGDWATETPKAKKKKKNRGLSSRQRINMLMALMMVMAILLGLQLIRHQLFGVAPEQVVQAAPAKLRPRGAIVDVNGHPLAIQRFRYEVTASPEIMSKRAKQYAAAFLAPRVNMEEDEIKALLEEYTKLKKSVILNSDVPPEVGEEIIAEDIMGIGVYIYPKRFHPEGTLASHVLGFVSVDNIGRYGLEDYFNSFLVAPTNAILPRPTPHIEPDQQYLVKEDEKVLPDSPFIPSLARRDLILTLDRTLQYIAETSLKAGIEKYRADSGVVIIMEPKTSAVLAMAGYPNYNPDNYSEVESDDVYVNPAISKIYEPGSVFKLITFAAALDAGIITPETEYLDTDKFIYKQQVVQNWDRKGRGEVTAMEALAQSLNVTTAKIASDVGPESFYRTVSRFGFGTDTGIELAYEVGGIVHSPGKGDWVPGYLATNSFGQAISVTPLQMANAVAAIAAGGVVHRPHIVSRAIKDDSIPIKAPESVSRAISPDAAKTLTQMMIAAANHTKAATIPGYAIAGKTGTAEIPGLGGYKEKRTITTFVGFFPADDPQFLILVKLVRPETSAWAGKTAAPIFREIAQAIINMYGIPPDEIRLHLQQ
jgi:cell division protein FtsI/penicillin-binding protein 2